MEESKWVEMYKGVKSKVSGNPIDGIIKVFAANLVDISIDCNIPIEELLERLNTMAVIYCESIKELEDESTKH